ncbi:MAG: flagellar hook assembly protein FlgD [Deltaproteobacteria bacterium]|nr:flagellar hook assembly protein FlgD [Deltaproteobacteria bacterium]
MATTEMIGTVAANNTASNTSNALDSSVVGKEDFLKLLVTQLQYQDPLNPAESTEFTAQLAQFSSLEQLTNVNKNLEYLQLYQASINNAQAVDFIGKTVSASGNTINVSDGVSDEITFELPEDAANVTISIYDASGKLSGTIESGDLSEGTQSVVWNAEDPDGNTVSDGNYTFEVAAVDSEGNEVAVSTFTKVTITGVTFEEGTAYLLAGAQKIAIGDVKEVYGSSES